MESGPVGWALPQNVGLGPAWQLSIQNFPAVIWAVLWIPELWTPGGRQYGRGLPRTEWLFEQSFSYSLSTSTLQIPFFFFFSLGITQDSFCGGTKEKRWVRRDIRGCLDHPYQSLLDRNPYRLGACSTWYGDLLRLRGVWNLALSLRCTGYILSTWT